MIKHISIIFLLLIVNVYSEKLNTKNFIYDVGSDFLVWQSRDDSFTKPNLYNGMKFRFFSGKIDLGLYSLSEFSLVKSDAGYCEHWICSFNDFPKNNNYEKSVFAVAGTNIKLASKYVEINNNSSTYKKVFKNYLEDNGIVGANIKIKQIIKTDLQKDGVDEVLINAYSIENMYHPKKGDYSIILLRELINGKVVTRIVDGQLFGENSDRWYSDYEIENILDYNNDGLLDVIVSESAHEHYGTSVYSYDKDKGLKRVLSEGTCAD